MATRAQIERIARQVDKLASVLSEANTLYVPLYAGESEDDALRAHDQPHNGSVVFNGARPGDRRQACEASGLHTFYCLGPSDVRRMMATIGAARRARIGCARWSRTYRCRSAS